MHDLVGEEHAVLIPAAQLQKRDLTLQNCLLITSANSLDPDHGARPR